MTNRGVLVAAATLVVANVLILAGVMRNRAGNPDAVVRLSERELVSWGDQSEGAETFLNLRVQWTMATRPDGQPWFDRAKLEALGVTDLPAPDDTTHTYGWMRPIRPGYVVLELAGPAWERMKAEKPAPVVSVTVRDSTTGAGHVVENRTTFLPNAGKSRLMAVDFGLDPHVLRQQHPERSQYLILPATFRYDLRTSVRDSAGNTTEPARIIGVVDELLPGTVHVPLPLRDSLLALGAARNDSTTRFEVTLKVGRKWEAWVE